MTTATLSIPPLRQGERLSEDEFMRRYEAMPDVKAELLDGVVYMSSPVTIEHADPHGDLMGWIYTYKFQTPGVASAADGTIRLPRGGIPQPDVTLRIRESHGGASYIDEDRYIAGSPELVAEVAKSSLDYDRTIKLQVYQKAGIREYILWRLEDDEIDWFVLRNGVYEQLLADSDGIIRSETFPGLWLDVEAMTHLDAVSVVRVLQLGIASPEHAQFVAKLKLAEVKQ